MRGTQHDHSSCRGRKGYLFIIGDEHAYDTVSKDQVKAVLGVGGPQSDMPFKEILAEAKKLYHVFFIIPNLTNHYNDKSLEKWWQERVGQQNCLKLEDPEKICELIVSAVALCEGHIGIDDLAADGVMAGAMSSALVPLSQSSAIERVNPLPAVPGIAGGTERP